MSNNILRQFALTVICLLGIGSAVAWSQNIQVKGVVLDENGAGMMGAGIIQKGTEGSTTNGTISDLDGNFQITVPQGSILVIQALGYVSQEVPASEYMRVQLETDSEMLNETVVVGYGVQKKSVVTAAISSITSDDLKAQSQNRLDNMLQGMASGVLVTQSSGSPSAGSQVRVRGVGTIHNSDPLFT